MNPIFILFIILFMLIYISYNYYIANKVILLLGNTSFVARVLIRILFVMMAMLFFVARFSLTFLPLGIKSVLVYVGGFWLGLIVYIGLLNLVGDLLFAFARFGGFHDRLSPKYFNKTFFSLVALSLSVMISVLGVFHSSNVKLVNYESVIYKDSKLDNIRIALISDLHLGKLRGEGHLKRVIELVNSQNPDLIVIPGDIIDDNLVDGLHDRLHEVLMGFDSKYGIYASLGNHDYMGGDGDKIERYLESANIKVLRDDYVLVEDLFYIVGREDKSIERFGDYKRKSLEDIIKGLDSNYPMILLDHQPIEVSQAKGLGVDFMASGHTHRGQLFPFRYITNMIYDLDWGIKFEDGFSLVVTSGAGTWGPPMRVGTQSEVVIIDVKFIPKTQKN